MQAIQPRKATLADAGKVLELTRAAYAKWVPIVGREPLPMTADYERAIAEHIIDLWEDNRELLALIELIPMATYLLIENAAVQPDQQGKGFGAALLRHAERVAVSLGHTEIRLYTNAAFASNLAFYSRHGYEEFLRETLGPGKSAVHMKKQIAAEI